MILSMITIAVGIAPLANATSYEDLPTDGGTLIVLEDTVLEIPIGVDLVLDGTIMVIGNASGPRLTIRNRGSISVQSAIVESRNSSIEISNLGVISGRDLQLSSVESGNVELVNSGEVDLEDIGVFAQGGGQTKVLCTEGWFKVDRVGIDVTQPGEGPESEIVFNQSDGNLDILELRADNEGKLEIDIADSTMGTLLVNSSAGSTTSVTVENLGSDDIEIGSTNGTVDLRLYGELRASKIDLGLRGGQLAFLVDGRVRTGGLDITATRGQTLGNLTFCGRLETEELTIQSRDGANLDINSMFGNISGSEIRILASDHQPDAWRSQVNVYNGEWHAVDVLIRNENANVNLQHRGYGDFQSLRIEGHGAGTTNLASSGTCRAEEVEVLNNASHINIANSGFMWYENVTLVDLAADTNIFNSGYIHAQILTLLARERRGLINITNNGDCDFNQTTISTTGHGKVNINTMFGIVSIDVLRLIPSEVEGNSMNILGGGNVEVSSLDSQPGEILTEIVEGETRAVLVFPGNSTVMIDSPGDWLPIPEPALLLTILLAGLSSALHILEADQEGSDPL